MHVLGEAPGVSCLMPPGKPRCTLHPRELHPSPTPPRAPLTPANTPQALHTLSCLPALDVPPASSEAREKDGVFGASINLSHPGLPVPELGR